jgi:hypothetical protein
VAQAAVLLAEQRQRRKHSRPARRQGRLCRDTTQGQGTSVRPRKGGGTTRDSAHQGTPLDSAQLADGSQHGQQGL